MLFYWRKETRSDLRSVLKAVKCWRISEHQWNTNISLISPCSLTEISAAHRSRHSFSRLDHAVVRVDATVQTGRDEGGMNSPAWAGRWSQSSRRSWCRGKRSTSPSPCSSCSGYLRKTNTRASLLLLFSSRKNLAVNCREILETLRQNLLLSRHDTRVSSAPATRTGSFAVEIHFY